MMMSFSYLLVLCLLVFAFANDEHSGELMKEKFLLVISLDGFRHDLINPNITPNLYEIASEGVHLSNGILSLVNTVTASNHQSIVTGLNQESHGIIDNTFFDPNFNQFYDVWNFHNDTAVANNSIDPKWYGGIPVWDTYEKETTKTVGLMRWPMCNIPSTYDHLKLCSPWEANNQLPDWMLDVDKLVGWFSKGTQFGMLYIPEPDHTQHSHDLKGSVVNGVIQDVDKLIGYLKKQLKVKGIWDQTDVIITGDHGHEPVDLNDSRNLVIIDEILGSEMTKSLLPSSMSYFLSDSKFSYDEIYKLLSDAQSAQNLSFHVWLKKDFPSHYHWKNSPRVGPLIVFPRKEAIVRFNTTREKVLARYKSDLRFGTHGYLNDEVESMRPLFLARGPSFKRSYTTDTKKAELIDVYLLICAILDISPAPNNATFSHVADLLQPELSESFLSKLNPPPFHWKSGGDEIYRFVDEYKSSLVVSISIVLPSLCLVAYLISCLFCRRAYQKVQVGPRSFAQSSSRDHFGNGVSTPTNTSKTASTAAKRNNPTPTNKPLLLLDKEGTSESEEL